MKKNRDKVVSEDFLFLIFMAQTSVSLCISRFFFSPDWSDHYSQFSVLAMRANNNLSRHCRVRLSPTYVHGGMHGRPHMHMHASMKRENASANGDDFSFREFEPREHQLSIFLFLFILLCGFHHFDRCIFMSMMRMLSSTRASFHCSSVIESKIFSSERVKCYTFFSFKKVYTQCFPVFIKLKWKIGFHSFNSQI